MKSPADNEQAKKRILSRRRQGIETSTGQLVFTQPAWEHPGETAAIDMRGSHRGRARATSQLNSARRPPVVCTPVAFSVTTGRLFWGAK